MRHHRLKRAYGLPTGGLFENGTALKIGPAHVAAASTARKEARDTGGAARQQSKFVLGNSTEPENTVRRRLRTEGFRTMISFLESLILAQNERWQRG